MNSTDKKNFIDVLLIHHHTFNENRPILVPAMGIFSIADVLDKNSIKTEIIHLATELQLDPHFDAVQYIEDKKVKVVGISVHWFFQMNDSFELAERIKNTCKDIKIVLGGFTASLYCNEIMEKYRFIDAIVRGDGEMPFLLYCQTILFHHNREINTIPNLIYREANSSVHSNEFTFVATENDLENYNFSRIDKLKNYKTFFKQIYYPTKLYSERFDFANNGVFSLETGRGCPYYCSLCGGNRKAQQKINNRPNYVFIPTDSVIKNIRYALNFNYKNFYICYDPQPSRAYYRKLFQKIRREKINIKLMFECWTLPTLNFIDDFTDTFEDGIIALSPDSANESIRKLHKGPISYTNEELHKILNYLSQKQLLVHLYFGFFLPSDNMKSVLQTRRFARELEGENCEVFYIAFSTDPYSPIQLEPDKYGMKVEVNNINDYLKLLTGSRITSNLMAHTPHNLHDTEIRKISLIVKIDQLLYQIVPKTADLIVNQFGHQILEDTLLYIVDEIANDKEIKITNLINILKQYISNYFPCDEDFRELITASITFESSPYTILEKKQNNIGLHYTKIQKEVVSDVNEYKKSHPMIGQDIIDFKYDISPLFAVNNWKQTYQNYKHPIKIKFTVYNNNHYSKEYL